MGHPPPPPVQQDATYTKQVYQHSKHYVGVERYCRGKKTKMGLFDRSCVV